MLLALILFNIHLSGQEEKEYLFELRIEETVEQEMKVPEEKNQLQTHMAYNESVKSRFEREVREFRTLEELREGKRSEEAEEDHEEETTAETPRNTTENEASDEGTIPAETPEETPQKSERSDGDDSSRATVKNNSVNRHSSISYSLLNRVHRYLPNPVYTCSARGKVVVNIRVNAAGQVTHADFNRKSSTSDNGCLVEQAITYALQATFESSEDRGEQRGTITYHFQGE
ncbi:hypothetical protein DN748_15755 [Sinomicrobium soli]|nr:hypothetical protein DN748_15755 [Sinomicrobium sp. N-1-3-6]